MHDHDRDNGYDDFRMMFVSLVPVPTTSFIRYNKSRWW